MSMGTPCTESTESTETVPEVADIARRTALLGCTGDHIAQKRLASITAGPVASLARTNLIQP